MDRSPAVRFSDNAKRDATPIRIAAVGAIAWIAVRRAACDRRPRVSSAATGVIEPGWRFRRIYGIVGTFVDRM